MFSQNRKHPTALTNRKNLRRNGRRQAPDHRISAHQMAATVTVTAIADAVHKTASNLALRNTKAASKARAVARTPAETGPNRNESGQIAGEKRSVPPKQALRRLKLISKLDSGKIKTNLASVPVK